MIPSVALLTPTMSSRRFNLFRTLEQAYWNEWPFDEWLMIGAAAEFHGKGTWAKARVIPGRPTIGEQRQAGLEAAKGSDIIVHIDDDDWYHPQRIQRQVQALVDGALLVGTRQYYCAKPPTFDVVPCLQWESETGCFPAGTMAYWREEGIKHGFAPGLGAEQAFQKAFPQDKVVDMKDPSLLVMIRHPHTTTGDDWCVKDWTLAASPQTLDPLLGPSWKRFTR